MALGEVRVFLRDVPFGTMLQVSLSSADTERNGDSYYPAINANGRCVAYDSGSWNLVAGDANGRTDV